MKKLQMITLMIALAFLAGCGTDSPTKPKAVFDLKLAYAKGSPSVLAKSVSNDNVGQVIALGTDINFGTLTGTNTFNLIIVNNSSDSITNVKVTSSNPKFTPAVTEIGTIGSPTEDFYTMPLIAITAVHGYVDGNSNVLMPIITYDDNYTDLVITGMFNGDSFTVNYRAYVEPVFFKPTFIDTSSYNTHSVKVQIQGDMVVNAESCPISAKWLVVDNAETRIYHTIDTTFYPNDTISNITLFRTINRMYFTCVSNQLYPYDTSAKYLKSMFAIDEASLTDALNYAEAANITPII